MHRSAPLEVREREIRLPVPAVRRAQQGEQCRVLREGQQLAVTPGPSLRREVEGEDANFCDEWVCHRDLLVIDRRVGPRSRFSDVRLEVQGGIKLISSPKGMTMRPDA